MNCKEPFNVRNVKVVLENEKAVSVTFQWENSLDDIHIFIEETLETSVLGTFTSQKDNHTFTPIIPFSPGQTYIIRHKSTLLTSFKIEEDLQGDLAKLTSIYPSIDKVPENLLKMYLQFSKPMQSVGSSLDYVTVTDTSTREEVDVFLFLNSELWNKEQTQLTLWLDPGRIKTDLIPNKEKGLPLTKGHEYILKISSNWKDADGKALVESYKKTFQVIERDARKPNVYQWQLFANPTEVTINFKETLDAVLASESFFIESSNGELVIGEYKLIDNEQVLKFIPNSPLKKGNYIIYVESKLEDLAGNNLNHLFDTDLMNENNSTNSEYKTLKFAIE